MSVGQLSETTGALGLSGVVALSRDLCQPSSIEQGYMTKEPEPADFP